MSRTAHPLHTTPHLGIPQDLVTADDLQGLAAMVNALKMAVEALSRQSGVVENSAVRVNDLVELGLIDGKDVEQLDRGGSK